MISNYEQEEQYIIDESQEVNIGESEGWTHKIISAFPAFRHRNYQLYFAGQLVSMTGTWLQNVALGWLVFQLTKSAYLVGLIAAIELLPVLFFALFAGVIVDRYPKRKVIIIEQSLALVVAAILGILTLSGHITVLQIAVLAFLLGITDAIDKPARQAFVVDMVGKKDMTSAIALNAGTFNAARVIGPAVAGTLIALYGTGWAFIINAMSFIFVIIAIYMISVDDSPHPSNLHPWQAVKNGLSYSFGIPHIKILLIFTSITAIFGWSYATLLPVVINTIFHQGASALGYFYGASGAGALVATVLVSTLAKKVNPLKLIIVGNAIFALSIIGFTLTTAVFSAIVSLFFAGLGIIIQFATIQTMIQHSIADEFRGRVMSIYVVMFMGMMPFGSYLAGFLAEHIGPSFTIQFGAGVVFLSGLYLYSKRKEIKKAYSEQLDIV